MKVKTDGTNISNIISVKQNEYGKHWTNRKKTININTTLKYCFNFHYDETLTNNEHLSKNHISSKVRKRKYAHRKLHRPQTEEKMGRHICKFRKGLRRIKNLFQMYSFESCYIQAQKLFALN